VCEPYSVGNVQFTQKDGKIYAFYLYKDENETVPEEIHLPLQKEFSRIDLIGGPEGLEYRKTDTGIAVRLPAKEREAKAPIAHAFRIQ
jgi:alpha-L-fucosidase